MKISVYITSYNRKQRLSEAIDSVLKQTLLPSQLILVDDGSVDGSQDVIRCYANQYPDLVTAIFHSSNQGVAASRIDALRAVKGDYVTYLDDDDRFLPTKLAREARTLEEDPDCQMVFSNYYFVDQQGERIGVWSNRKNLDKGNTLFKVFARQFPKRWSFKMGLVNYEAWSRIGFYDPHLALWEDFDMEIRLAKQLKTVYVEEPLSEIRLFGNGVSKSRPFKHIKALRYVWKKNSSYLIDMHLKERREVEREYGRLLTSFSRLSPLISSENVCSWLGRGRIAERYYMSWLHKCGTLPDIQDFLFVWRIKLSECLRVFKLTFKKFSLSLHVTNWKGAKT